MQPSILFPYAVWGVFGLVFGSFLNVCIARLPNDESIVAPRSRCPKCGHPIRWYDNVPVLSYVFLGGRCRDCHAKISLIYPLVELLSAAVWIAGFAKYEFSPEFVKVTVFNMLVLIVVFTDLLERRVPHAVTISGMLVGFAASFVVPVDARPLDWVLFRVGFIPGLGLVFSVLGGIAGALLGGGLFYAVGETFYRLSGKTKEYLGFGDVMLMLMVGFFLGPLLTLMTILLGSLLGTLVAVPLNFIPRFRNYHWPYATFLGAAAIFAGLWGGPVLQAYLHWAGFV